MTIVPCSLRDANAFVAEHHRHHGTARGHKFSVAAAVDGELVGVCIVGRPVARRMDDGWTLEVVRLATNGHKNTCSALYAAAWRAARAMGYRRLITYILDTERGTSLRAAGWTQVAATRGGSWSRAERPRVDKHSTQPKLRFEVCA